MATVNYSWTLPTVGGSEDTWGDENNALWTALDALLGGVNATEFDILDGATVTTAELNKLDGLTATTAELNFVDGVTSAIQTQLNSKMIGANNLSEVTNAATARTNIGAISVADIPTFSDSVWEAGTETVAGIVSPAKVKAAIEEQVPEVLNAGGAAPVYACRAWVNFNGTGTVAIRASGNVSSITDNGTGDYTVNFTTDMPDADYAVAGMAQRSSGNELLTVGFPVATDGAQRNSSGVRLYAHYTNGGGVEDSPLVTVMIAR